MAREDQMIDDGSADELVELKKGGEAVAEDGKKVNGTLADRDDAPIDGVTELSGEEVFVEGEFGEEPEERDSRQSADDRDLSPDERRERNRTERQRRKERRREGRERDGRRFAELENQLAEQRRIIDELRGGRDQSTVAQIAERIAHAQRSFTAATAAIKKATEAGDGDALNAALDQRDAAREAYRSNTALKQRLEREPVERERERQAPARQLGRRGQEYAENFRDELDPETLTQDELQAVMRLDAAVASEGYDPESKEYWTELRKRVKRRGVDMRLDDDEDDRDERRPAPRVQRPPTGQNGSGAAGRKGIYLPKEYVESCKAAGKWDNLEKRKEMIERYRASSRKYGTDRATRA